MENTYNKIVRNSIILLIGSLINQFFILLIGLWSAKFLGPENYGILSLASSINFIFIFFIELGMHQYLIRETAKDYTTTQYYISGILNLKIVLSLFLFLVTYILLKLSGYDELITNIVLITSITYIVNSFVFCLYAVIQAKQDMTYIAYGYIGQGILIFIGIFLSINNNWNIYIFAFVPLIANLIILLYIVILVKFKYKLNLFKISIKKRFLYEVKKAIPFGVTGLLVVIYLWSNSIWISLFHGENQVGIFNASLKIIFAFFVVSLAINMTIYPILSNAVTSNPITIKRLYNNLTKIMGIISILLMLITYFSAPFLVNILLGNFYIRSIFILQLLSLIIPFVFIRSVYERFLDVSGNQHLVTLSYFIGAVVNLLLNIILIYFFEIEGAALSLLITDFIIFVFIYYFYKKSNNQVLKN